MTTKSVQSSGPNDEVLSFCTMFSRRLTPGLAVMLYGEWGCGKTWFLEHRLMPSIRDAKDGRPCLYVSLNGLASKEEIQAKVLQAIAENAAEGGKKPNAVKSIIDKGVRVGRRFVDAIPHWTMGGIKLAAAILTEMAVKRYFSKERPVVIFDDLERCSLKDEELLGLLNYYVEHLHLPVFVVCNYDEKIKKTGEQSDDGTAEGSFARVLEKVIGWRIVIRPELDRFLLDTVKEIECNDTRELLQKLLPELRKIMSLLKKVNLRSWRLALYHFATVDKAMVDDLGTGKAKEHMEGREQVLRRVLAGTIHSRERGTKCEEVLKLLQDRIHHRGDDEEDKEKAETTKYLTVTFLDDMVTFDESPYEFIGKLVDEGVVDVPAIVRLSHLLTGYGVTETEKRLRMLSTDAVHRLEDKEANDLAAKSLTALASGEYRKADVFRTLGRSLLTLGRIGMIDIDVATIEANVRKGIEATEFDFDESLFDDMTMRSGPSFSAEDQKVQKLIVEKLRRQLAARAEKVAHEKIAMGPKAFFDWACDTNNPFIRRALFAYADVESFWKATLALPNTEKCDLASGFSMRFAYVNSHFRIAPEEVEWLKKSGVFLKVLAGGGPKGISGSIIRDFIETTEKYTTSGDEAVASPSDDDDA